MTPEEMHTMLQGGERARLSTAAERVGVRGPTARSWKLRDRAFAEAVDAISDLPPVRPPEPPPEPVPEPEPQVSVAVQRRELEDEIRRWRKIVLYERGRARRGAAADPDLADRHLSSLIAQLQDLNWTLETGSPG